MAKSIKNNKIGAVVVIGGGIGGIQASLDLAEMGFKVYLLDKSPTIGGVMAQLDKTFPTNDCSMCILSPKLVECARHLNIEIITCADFLDVQGEPGNLRVSIRKRAGYVDTSICTGCGDCVTACPVEIAAEFELGLARRKAIYRPFPQAVPNVFTIDKRGYPPCQVACPAGVNAQGYITLISQGKFKEALQVLRRTMPFAGVCGRVCTHPCETECERGKVDEPIAIRSLKRFMADYELKSGREKAVPVERTKRDRVAIIGSGPAGLACAYDLVRQGYPVTVFEAAPEPGGLLRYAIPEYRLPKEILDNEISYIEELGVEIKTNTPVKNLEDIFEQGYGAIFLATGAGTSQKMNIPNEDTPGVIYALDFLRQLNSGMEVRVGERVAVVGGGNAAVDAARVARRLGAKDVTIIYRRSRAEMPAIVSEINETELEGIRLNTLAAPVRVLMENGHVAGIECIRMELGEPDASGRPRPLPVKGSEFQMALDSIIIAIGQAVDRTMLPKELNYTERETVAADPVTLATNMEGVFAGGDMVRGPDNVIDAIASGKEAAISISRYLEGVDLKEGRPTSRERVSEVSKEGVEKKPRQAMPVLEPERRKSFAEVELGLDEEAAADEARRCLSCGVCSECLECVKVCQAKAIDHEMKEEVINIAAGAIILAPGFEEFDASRKSEYGYGRYANVVTSIGFERILNASGPFSGELLRPSDKKMPRRIAFIQCVGSRDRSCHRSYCSAVCCMYATKEAVIAREHAPGVEATIFYMDLRAYGKGFYQYAERARSEYGVRYIRARVPAIEEVPETKNLRITYETEDGQLVTEDFDLVVLSVGLEAPQSAEEMAERLGIQLEQHGFCRTNTFSPVETSWPGVYVCGAFSGPKDIPETVTEASAAAAEVSRWLAPARGMLSRRKEYPPEIDVTGQEPRIGVFVCHCGINIAGYIDVPKVLECVKTIPNVVYVEENLYTCSPDTQQRIKEKIREHSLNRVVVASCTPRTHEPLFQQTMMEAGLNPYLFEMANIREQCSWVHEEKADATEKAKDLVKMAVAKARLLAPLDRMSLDINPVALVVGGGISGLISALSLSEQGLRVHLVEQSRELGGIARRIHHTLEGEDVQAYLTDLITRISKNPLISSYLESGIVDVSGYVGNFTTRIKGPDNDIKEIKHGAAIIATGAQEYKSTEYQYGENPRVLTLMELENEINRGSDKIQDCDTLVMIQCVGSRDDQRPYCSRVCCSEAIKCALELKKVKPRINIYILYRDIMTYGFKEDYYEKARAEGVVFLRYEPEEKPEVTAIQKDGKNILRVKLTDTILDETLLIDADLLALGVATVAAADNKKLSQLFKVPLNADGFFLEAHAKLRPIDFATEGIFLCGLAHGPKFIEESIAQAKAAAGRAATILLKDSILAEGIVCSVNESLCSGCGICQAVCSYSAIELDKERKVANLNKVLCKGCGTCCAACPSGAIEQGGFTTEQINAQLAV